MALDPVSEANAAEAIEVPTHLTAAAKFVLSQSTLFELRGSSFKIKCKLCGFEVVSHPQAIVWPLPSRGEERHREVHHFGCDQRAAA